MIRTFNFTWNDVLNASNLCIEKEEIEKTVFVTEDQRVWKVDDLNSKISIQNFVRFMNFANNAYSSIPEFTNDFEAASIIETLFKPIIDSVADSEDEDTKEYFLIRFLARKIIKMQIGFETENYVAVFSSKVRNRVISWKMGPVSKLILKSLM